MLKILLQIFNFAGERKNFLTKAMVASFLGAVFAALQFAAMALAFDMLFNGRSYSLIVPFVIMLVSVIGRYIFLYVATNMETDVGFHMVSDKRVHIGDRLRYVPMGFFNESSTGNISALVTTTLGDVENVAARALVVIFGGFFNTAALCIMLLAYDWRCGLVAVLGIAVYLLVTNLSVNATVKTGPARQQAQENLAEGILEYVQGMAVVKSFGLLGEKGMKVDRVIAESGNKAVALEMSVMPWSFIRKLTVKVFSLLLIIASLLFYYSGSMETSSLLLMLIVSFLIYRDLESAGNMADNLQMLSVSMKRADETESYPVMKTNGRKAKAEDASVIAENISFSYGGRKVIDNVSFEIPSGSVTAVVGPSGGGKTTLTSLIARFWDVDDGTIRIGGRDIRDYETDELMSNISMVFQDVYLFQDTIGNNIRFGSPDATEEEIIKAAKAACCHDFITALPDGYNTMVGEGGKSLSGGEMQRISIARAILKDAPIIILDEATSSVDPENEAELQKAINALTGNKTVIMIAHRIKTVRNADQILVLKDGRIIDRGRHAELMERCTLYRDFVSGRSKASDWML